MLKFFDLKCEAFGLDVNDASVRVARLKRKRGTFCLSSFGEEKIEKGAVESGIIKDEKALLKSLKAVLNAAKGGKIDTKYAVVSLPEEESFLEVIQMPPMSQEELGSAIAFQAENYIPLPINDVYLDFQIIPPIKGSLDHIDVLLAAIPKKTADSYLSCLKQARIVPLAFELKSQAIVRALVKDEVSQKPLVLIDFEENSGDMIVFSGHSVRFTCSVSISSSMDDLALQIKKYIDFYQEHASHEHLLFKSEVEKIILCGNGTNLQTLPEFLSEKLTIPVELGDPFVNFPAKLSKSSNLSKHRNLDGFKNPVSYAAALGLALRGIINKKI